MERRDFLKKALMAAGSVALGGGLAGAIGNGESNENTKKQQSYGHCSTYR